MKSSDKENIGVLVIDLGAFRTRAAMVGPSWVPKVVEVPTKGYSGYISNLDTLVLTVRRVVEELAKTVPIPPDDPIPTIITVHLSESTQFKVANHEVSVSQDGKVTEEQVEKLHRELRDKVTGNDGNLLFLSVSRYMVVQRGKERDVENPRGLRVEILKGMAVAMVVTSDIYENLMDIFREYNDRYDTYELEPLGVYSSPMYAALGAADSGVDTHLHLDLGHTSFRVVKLINGKVFSYAEYPRGGKHIIKDISSTLSIPPKASFHVLKEYLGNGKRIVRVTGKDIDTTIVEEILRRSFSEFLTNAKVRSLVTGSGDRSFTLSVSGGLSVYRKIGEYISDAGFPEPLTYTDVLPENFVFHGIWKVIEERGLSVSRVRRNGRIKGRGFIKRFTEFFKKEVLGLEEKGG